MSGTRPAKGGRNATSNTTGTSDDHASTSVSDNAVGSMEPTGANRRESTGGSPLQRFCSRDDGWLRAAPDGDGKAVYLKWKFTTGPHKGLYVMVLCNHFDVAWGLEVLEQKVEEVYLGVRRAVIDKWYQND